MTKRYRRLNLDLDKRIQRLFARRWRIKTALEENRAGKNWDLELTAVNAKLKKLKRVQNPKVTDHAVIRYFERVLKVNVNYFKDGDITDSQLLRQIGEAYQINVESLKKTLISDRALHVIHTVSTGLIPSTDTQGRQYKLRVQDGVIVTIIGEE